MAALYEAVLWVSANRYSGSGPWQNLGYGGAALDLALPGGAANPTWLGPPTWGSALGYAYLPGTGSQQISVVDAAVVTMIGDITVDLFIAPDFSTPSAPSTVISKYGTAGQRSWRVSVEASGAIRFTTSADGTAALNNTTTATAVLTASVGKWLRISFDANDGAGNRVCGFYLSDDGETWTLLETVTTAGATSIFDSTTDFWVGRDGGGNPWAGKMFQARVFNAARGGAPGGSPALDIDFTATTEQTSFVCTTGQTVTIARFTGGKKIAQVIEPIWLLGTDDYFSTADNALEDFAATDSFTAFVRCRRWATTATSGIMCKRSSSATTATAAGWLIRGTTDAEFNAVTDDGAQVAVATTTGIAEGSLVTFAFTSVPAGPGRRNTPYVNGVAGTSATNASLTGTLANSQAFEVGRAGTDYAAMELLDVMLYRSALTAAEILGLTAALATQSAGGVGGTRRSTQYGKFRTLTTVK